MDPMNRGLFNAYVKEHSLENLAENDAFELYCASLYIGDQLTKNTPLTDLLLDPGTPAIDIAVLEINGEIAWNADDANDRCEAAVLDICLNLLQAKNSDKVNTRDITSLAEKAYEIVTNSLPEQPAFEKLAGVAEAFHSIYENHATKLQNSTPRVRLIFATTAPDASINDVQVQNARLKMQKSVSKLDYISHVDALVLGASDLSKASRRRTNANSVDISFQRYVNLPEMPGIQQAILGVVSIAELVKLFKTEQSGIEERVFYDNVRGFKGLENAVNSQIYTTLSSPERALLPVLNNGVTVVASSYAPKPGDAVALSGFQIVNGCQTSHCIFLAQEVLGKEIENIFVPIRVVVTEVEAIASKIILATNSQSEVEESDLIALSVFQKDLEEYYQQYDHSPALFYERRMGQFYNKTVTRARVVSIREQMRSVAAVFLDLPHSAARYPKHLNALVGKQLFAPDHKFGPYWASAFAAYRLEAAFRSGLESQYKPYRYHILMVFKFLVLGEGSAMLNSKRAQQQSESIVKALSEFDIVDKFRQAAKLVISAQGDAPLTSDRLKRERFSSDLKDYLRSQGFIK